MNYQSYALRLVALSTFGVLSFTAVAQALPEQELNSTLRPQTIGKVTSAPVRVAGQITGNRDEDVFRFEIAPGQDVKAVLTVNGDVDLEVHEDQNPDGQLGVGDRKKISINEGKQTEEVNFKTMKSRFGFIRIMDSGGAGLSGTVNYNLTLTAVPADGQPRIESR